MKKHIAGLPEKEGFGMSNDVRSVGKSRYAMYWVFIVDDIMLIAQRWSDHSEIPVLIGKRRTDWDS